MRRRHGIERPLGICMILIGGCILLLKVLPSGMLWMLFGLALITGGCCILRR